MSPRKDVVNPHKKPRPFAAHNREMGRQSQQRVTNTKRAYQLASSANNNNKKKVKVNQSTLQGGVAFNPQKDCVICKAPYLATFVQGARTPNRAHHVLCKLNKKTKGLGVISEQNLATAVEEKRLKDLFERPLNANEKASSKHCTAESVAAHFAPRKQPLESTKTMSAPQVVESSVTTKSIDFCKGILDMVADAEFRDKHKTKSAPLAVIAFASIVVEQVVRPKQFSNCFSDMTMVVPATSSANNNPHCHSIVGQKLLHVDWIAACGVNIGCPDQKCKGVLRNDRTNFSKNKTLFPLFGLDGPPSWAIVMKMTCPCCKRQFDSNNPEVLLSLPAHMANQCPVETKFALSNHSFHLTREATNVMDPLMLTHGNGEMCSDLLYRAINTTYLRKISDYLSCHKHHRGSNVSPHVAKDGVHTKQCPPKGDAIRDMCNESATSPHNRWGISDHDRHAREIQGVTCSGIFAQDHTFSVVKNYQSSLGATAVWDVAVDTGEIATAVCVPTTQTMHFSHAAKALQKHCGFNPSATHSDAWPCKESCWSSMWPETKGRLGLFHCEKRTLRTIRKTHVDFHSAVTDLMDAVCEFESTDYEKLLVALKDGTLGKKHTTEEIATLKKTKCFRDRCGKHLRKKLHQPNTMVQRLDDWFVKYKVTSSGGRPAGGRLDPSRGVSLFTSETKTAVENCKDKAMHLSDPLPVDDMHFPIKPNPNSRHQLTEHLSKRGESKLEAFHDRLANFANSGMRDALADNLHLAGTARHNLSIRHKRLFFTRITTEERKKLPAAWEKVVPCWNHSELWHVNLMATDLGMTMPFPMAERLPPDNGERFFSEHVKLVEPTTQEHSGDHCLCLICGDTNSPPQLLMAPPKTTPPTPAVATTQPTQQWQLLSNPIVALSTQ